MAKGRTPAPRPPVTPPLGAAGAIAKRGIRTSGDFADLMSAVMSDLVQGHITPLVATATCNAGGKLLKLVELELRLGSRGQKAVRRPVQLIGGA